MPKISDMTTTAQGEAALSICESMLIALSELKIFTQKDARDVLLDASSAHRGAGGTTVQVARHEAVAVIIDRIRTSANSVHQ